MWDARLLTGFIADEPETDGSDHAVRADHGVGADAHVRLDSRAGVEQRAGPDGDVRSDRTERLDDDVLVDIDRVADYSHRRDGCSGGDAPADRPWLASMLIANKLEHGCHGRPRTRRFQHSRLANGLRAPGLCWN